MSVTTDSYEDLPALERAKVYLMAEIITYAPNAVLSKTIIKKATGNITLLCFNTGEELADKLSPFDIFLQVIDGTAEVIINQKMFHLQSGHGIIVPAHALHRIHAHEPFKMISTVIKSGYED